VSTRRARPLLGTLFEISVANDRSSDSFEAAFGAAERVHRLMSAHDPESDVSKINRAKPGDRVAVDPWTYQVLASACGFARSTGGLFDPCVAPLLQDAAFLPRFAEPCADGWGDYRHLELLGHCTVRARCPLQITLDGIAKGFAVDKATEALRESGAEAGVVNAGGDLRAFGPTPEPVYVRDPAAPGRFFFVGQLCEGALATSAPYFSRTEHEGRQASHIFHPKKGSALLREASASVVARDCMTADALAKAVLLDARRMEPVLARHHARAIVLGPETECA